MALLKKVMLILSIVTVYLGCGNGDKVCKSQADCLSCETCNRGCCLPREGEICQPSCTNGDGLCPAQCDATNDSDCKSVCGNWITEPGELCDGFDCPTSCTPADACKPLQLIGSKEQCNAECVPLEEIQSCTSNDGCCPAGCTFNSDNDCSPWTTEKVYSLSSQSCTSLYSPPSVGSLQLDKNDNEHFLVTENDSEYIYLYRNDDKWRQEDLPMFGLCMSLLVDSNGNAYIIHTAFTQGDPGVGYYYKDQGLWLLKIAASAPTGYNITGNLMTIGQDGKFHFAFTESNDTAKTYKLNYAKPVADSWEIQTVEDRDQTSLMYFTLDKNDNPHIFYLIQSQLIWARLENNIWKKMLLPEVWSAKIALDIDDNPTICYNTSYTDTTIKCIRVINDNIETITEFQGDQGDNIISLAIDSQFNIHILYNIYNKTNQLKYIKWNGNTLVDYHVVAKNVNSADIVLDKNGKPVIVYTQDCDVMFGRWSNTN